MTMPNFPNVPELPDVDVCQSLALVVESVALEELSLAHLINAEAEKVQKVADKAHPVNTCDMVKVNQSVSKTLVNIIKLQMLLQFKLENVLDKLPELLGNDNMQKINIPLAHKTLCFHSKSRLTVELAVTNQRGLPKMQVSWHSIRAEFPYDSVRGEKVLNILVPDGECSIPTGCSMHTLFKYSFNIPDELAEVTAVPKRSMVFSRLSGFLNPEKNEHSLLLKWRFTVSENSVDMLMPWSYCYKGQECSGNIPPVVPVIPFIQPKPPAEEPVSYLICRYPENVAYLDSNLDFVVGVGSKENKSLDNIILQGMIKPTPGVKLQVVSMDEANTINPEATYITAENPGVFTYHLSQIAPRSQIVRHIIVKLIKAPSGTSLVEYTAKLFGGNEESYSEKGITTLNITPVINKGELQLKILASLVREEAGIAEILRYQAEKIEKGLSLATDISSIIRVDESIQDTLKTLIKYHILQEFKLEEALKMDKGS